VTSFVGSGKLDGNGIPADFFNDVHIRKAFSYAFDWDTYVNDVYKGEAVQSLELPMPGMVGYDANAPHYSFDLEKSAEEFKLADVDHNGVPDGQQTEGGVWNVGFRVPFLTNEGNTTRQIVGEILADNLKKVNDKFDVEVQTLTWPNILAVQRAGQAPLLMIGWIEDIHDPSNWYQPYTIGTYGSRQHVPDDLKAQFKTLLGQAIAEPDSTKRAATYNKINQLYYDNALGFPLVIQTSHAYEQTWLKGNILNPIFGGAYYYPMSKTSAAKDATSLVNAEAGDIDTLDPALAYDTSSSEIIQNIYETLIFYKGDKSGEFAPQLATEVPSVDNGGISADGKTYTFKIRSGVKFQNGDTLTPSDVAFSLQRGLLQGGSASPQWLLYEAFFGTGTGDIAELVDSTGALDDARADLIKTDPAKLKAVCERVKSAIVADDKAGTVTLNLAQSWSPMVATLAQTWGSVMDQKWVAANKGWDGSCDTWQNFYGMQSADDPLTSVAMGTGPYALDHRTPGTEIVMKANDNYWNTAPTYDGGPSGLPSIKTVTIKYISEWGTRFSMLQTGEADIVYVPVENRSQADALVGEKCVWDATANAYKACTVEDASKPLRLHIGRPQANQQDVVTFNFNIK
jgi:ABC-type transport system substrate-binding protein